MTDKMFDHRPDPELGTALRGILAGPNDDHAAFVARVMAGYDAALERASAPTWDVLASWSRRGIAAAAAAALLGGLLLGRAGLAPSPGGESQASIEAAMTPPEAQGFSVLTADEPPDASVVVEPQ